MTTDQWLIRTAQNWIAGPYSKNQVCQMILEGKLGLQDEVCAANHYWIYLHEREEIIQHLGVTVPKSDQDAMNSEEETTQPHLSYQEKDVTDPDITQVRTQMLTEVPAAGATTMAKSSQKRRVSSASSASLRPSSTREGKGSPQVEVVGQIDKPSFWQGFAWVLIAASGLLVLFVVRFLNR